MEVDRFEASAVAAIHCRSGDCSFEMLHGNRSWIIKHCRANTPRVTGEASKRPINHSNL